MDGAAAVDRYFFEDDGHSDTAGNRLVADLLTRDIASLRDSGVFGPICE